MFDDEITPNLTSHIIRGDIRWVAWHPLPIIFKKRKKEKEKEKKGKIKKKDGKKKIITNDHNVVYKWVKTDEFLKG